MFFLIFSILVPALEETTENFLKKKQSGVDQAVVDAILASFGKVKHQSEDQTNDAKLEKKTDNNGGLENIFLHSYISLKELNQIII